MKILMTVNSDFENFLTTGAPDYQSTHGLYQSLEERGHDTHFMFPDEAGEDKHYKLGEDGLYQTDAFHPDLFFQRGFGQNRGSSVSERYFDWVESKNGEIPRMINPAYTNRFDLKDKQLELDAPRVTTYFPGNVDELAKIVGSDRVVAKPLSGQLGRGILFLENPNQIPSNFNEKLNEYCFEEYNPTQTETRYFILDGKVILRRDIERSGTFGNERTVDVKLNSGSNESHLAAVHNMITQTNLVYGSIDFRGDFLLELNGSGTATDGHVHANALGKKGNLYDIKPQLMQYIER